MGVYAGMDFYLFVTNNPSNFLDPFGLIKTSFKLKANGALNLISKYNQLFL